MWKSVLLGAVVWLAACGGSTEPKTSVYGTYTLRTINGLQLPQNIYADASASLAIASGTLTLSSNNTYSLVEQEHIVVAGVPSEDVYSETGTFTQSGTGLQLTSVAGGTIQHQMIWNGNQISWTDVFINTTSTYVFTR